MADAATLTAGFIAAATVVAVGGWTALRLRGPERTLRAARRALERGDQATALALLGRIRPAAGAATKSWHAEQRLLEAEALYAAAETALEGRRFEEALENYRSVSRLVGLDEADASRRVVAAMLAEVRRLSAAAPDGPALSVLLSLILEREPDCAEASFWLGLFHLRHKDTAASIAALSAAHAATEGKQIDPAVYLGAIWLREGKPRDALRVLAEANRIAPNCPLVSWQLGEALSASGGDAVLALRALQKATGPEGLPKYAHAPQRLWAETLPADSWVRNLAQRATRQRVQFQCPLGLDRVTPVLESARLNLGETLVACDRAEEAVPVFTDLLQSRSDARVRRGLGLALAQLGEWDEAVPHLRAAQEAEQPPTPTTTGALAVCLVHAGGDRFANVRQALDLIASLNVRSDAGWARRAGAVFAAAKAAGVTISADQVAKLADVLASTDAADPTAAAVYDLLAGLRQTSAKDPELSACARLYVRAAQRHGVNLPYDVRLFDLAMADRSATREFFAEREWDFDAVERLYLQRWAERHPGTFPSAPGPGYAAEATTALLADARRLAAHKRPEAAIDVARLVLKLRPDAGPAHDLLAELAFRGGDPIEAADRLKAWYTVCPADPVPLARLAALTAAANRPGEALATARQALERVRGLTRVPYQLLAARFALAAGKPAAAVALFDECLVLAPDHPTALAGRAALAWTDSDFPKLASLADRMAAVPAEDPWFHYLGGAAMLVAGQLKNAEVSARHAANDPGTAAEGRHLLALVRDRRNDTAGAAELLQDATIAGSAAADHAVALRGQAAWRGGDYAGALRCWQSLPQTRLKSWNLASIMGGTAFLAGVQALRDGDSEGAANWLRQAARLGHAHPRLESLLTVACTRAGASGQGLDLLEQAVEARGPKPELVLPLARSHRQAGRLAQARLVLDRAAPDEPTLAHERGLLALAEGQLVSAERAFAAAVANEPESAAAVTNLIFARLSLGRLAEAVSLLPNATALAPTPELKRLLQNLSRLTARPAEAPAEWSVDDDLAVINCLRSLGRLESVEPLFTALRAIRGQSPSVKTAESELLPLRAKAQLDRGDAVAAREILEPHADPKAPALVRNLLGISASYYQDFPRAVRHFQAALPPIGDDAQVQQNLAVIRDWAGDVERSQAHWRRFLELQAGQTNPPPGVADYHRRIAALVKERLKRSVAFA
jgi:tetratricopeptide (TPR) repeat protein